MTCTYCGHENTPGTRYCVQCGRPLAAAVGPSLAKAPAAPPQTGPPPAGAGAFAPPPPPLSPQPLAAQGGSASNMQGSSAVAGRPVSVRGGISWPAGPVGILLRLLITVAVAFLVGMVYFLLTRDLRPLVLMTLVGIVFFLVDLIVGPHLTPLWSLLSYVPAIIRTVVGYAVPILFSLFIASLQSTPPNLIGQCGYFFGYLIAAAIAYVCLKNPLPVRPR